MNLFINLLKKSIKNFKTIWISMNHNFRSFHAKKMEKKIAVYHPLPKIKCLVVLDFLVFFCKIQLINKLYRKNIRLRLPAYCQRCSLRNIIKNKSTVPQEANIFAAEQFGGLLIFMLYIFINMLIKLIFTMLVPDEHHAFILIIKI